MLSFAILLALAGSDLLRANMCERLLLTMAADRSGRYVAGQVISVRENEGLNPGRVQFRVSDIWHELSGPPCSRATY